MARLTFPPVISPTRKPLKYPFHLPPQLDPSCVLCLLPIHDDKWYDFSGHGNHGVIHNATWTAKGRHGPALYFDGLDDYVNCGTNDSLNLGTHDLSIEVWFKTTEAEAGSRASLISKYQDGNNRWYLHLNASHYLKFYARNGVGAYIETTSIIDVHDGILHQAVLVLDRGNPGGWYIDGVRVAAAASNVADFDNTGPLHIARCSTGFMNITIDEIRIYKRALLPLEPEALYELGRLR